mmetsp:Transcript_17150/g.25610  ORF Transcript_17150/g.25610 Transcript_17150/m.25610 type:complete len:136 (+) Transcript_17150:227-634(+)
MSLHFRARRKRGACYGTLWKQHSSVSPPHNLSSFKEQAEQNHKISTSSSLDDSSISKESKHSISRKEASIRSDYMNMIAGDLDEDAAPAAGDGKGKEVATTSNNRTSIISLAGSYKSLSSRSAGVETLTAALEKK